MKRFLLVVLGLAAAVFVIFALTRHSNEAPEIPFAKTTRETISNVLSTNGKVEPVEFMDVRVDTSGIVKKLLVHAGDTVRRNQVLAELSEPGVEEQIEAAQAKEAEARAGLETMEAGGSSSELAEIDGNLSRLRSDRAAAAKNLASLQRLRDQQAATQYEVDQARQAQDNLDVQIQSLEKRRAVLVGKGDLAGAKARVDEAQANLRLARNHLAQNIILAPMAGTVYDLPVRAGAYLNPGDPLASIGRLNPVHVRVYVDEPDLGRVAPDEKVRITWDALPGKEWNGVVEKKPTEVVALGSREVGEVLCTIDNPELELTPGTNVNAFILTQVVPNALTIPKSAIRRDNGTGVFVLMPDQTVRWQLITTGASDALRVEVLTGIHDGQMVALPTDQPLKNGEKVSPAVQ